MQKVVDSPSSKQGANEYSSSHITNSKESTLMNSQLKKYRNTYITKNNKNENNEKSFTCSNRHDCLFNAA